MYKSWYMVEGYKTRAKATKLYVRALDPVDARRKARKIPGLVNKLIDNGASLKIFGASNLKSEEIEERIRKDKKIKHPERRWYCFLREK